MERASSPEIRSKRSIKNIRGQPQKSYLRANAFNTIFKPYRHDTIIQALRAMYEKTVEQDLKLIQLRNMREIEEYSALEV